MNNSNDPITNITNIIQNVYHLIDAHKLLEEIYLHIGPYNEQELSNELVQKINHYFKFDDSE